MGQRYQNVTPSGRRPCTQQCPMYQELPPRVPNSLRSPEQAMPINLYAIYCRNKRIDANIRGWNKKSGMCLTAYAHARKAAGFTFQIVPGPGHLNYTEFRCNRFFLWRFCSSWIVFLICGSLFLFCFVLLLCFSVFSFCVACFSPPLLLCFLVSPPFLFTCLFYFSAWLFVCSLVFPFFPHIGNKPHETSFK